VVVHHSESGWNASTEVSELFSGALVSDPTLQNLIPRLSFILDDISQATDAELLARAVVESERVVPLVLWALRDARAAERIMVSFRAWAEVMAEISRSETGRDALIAVIGYLTRAKAELSREQIETIVSEAAPEAKETYMTLAEQLHQEGRQQGRQETLIELLVRQLQFKFGELSDEAAHKVASASSSDLELWAERVLTAGSLDEVFQ